MEKEEKNGKNESEANANQNRVDPDRDVRSIITLNIVALALFWPFGIISTLLLVVGILDYPECVSWSGVFSYVGIFLGLTFWSFLYSYGLFLVM